MAFDSTCQQSGERTQNGHSERRPLGISNLSGLYRMHLGDLQAGGYRDQEALGTWQLENVLL